ncbi:uncharacterized protein LOC111808822 isoform X3 [Cucurbita pepo subsp. pepo]|uniref:uncharacterized protein LOC111808822 isoform X3 n=1 Tax=Cucurbita pepo subsp. pepo TaxID=3664 RepID=UPI000C9D5449|nr:uncharacterized protein LOC111808822 isoform X3 [Cucurbita pepo subsp. pepo]
MSLHRLRDLVIGRRLLSSLSSLELSIRLHLSPPDTSLDSKKMSETPKVIGMKEDESPKFPFTWFSFLPKFDLRLPLPINGGKKPPATVMDEGPKDDDDAQKPEFVRFPKANLAVPSVEVEADVSGKTSNPAVIWQVYALGGFLILSWAWARWKERRPKRRSDDDDENEDSRDT